MLKKLKLEIGEDRTGYGKVVAINNDGTCEQIADIDSKIGGAMALDYDTYEDVLWIVSDNGYNNRAAKISFNGTTDVDIVHVNAQNHMLASTYSPFLRMLIHQSLISFCNILLITYY